MYVRLKQQAEETSVFASMAALLCYALLFIVLPSAGFANDNPTKDLIDTSRDQLWNDGGTVNLLSIIFYLVGIGLVGKGLLNAKKQSEGGQGAGLSGWLPIMGPMGVGSLMIAMPSAVDLIWGATGIDATESLSADDLKAHKEACGAAADTIGAAICRVYKGISPEGGNILSLINAISIIVGVLVVGSGLTGAYRLSAGGQGAPKISGVAWRSLGGGALIALPAAIQTFRKSLFENPEQTSNFELSKFNVADDGGVDQAITTFVDNLKDPFINITFFIFMLIGIVMITRTLYAMSGINFEQQKMTPTAMISRLVIGGMLVSAWSIYEVVTITVIGASHSAESWTLAYSSDALDTVSAERVKNVLNAALVWVQMIGILAFFRGFMVLKSSLDGQGQGSISAGMTHIIAGALCINIPWTILMIQNTIPGIKMLE